MEAQKLCTLIKHSTLTLLKSIAKTQPNMPKAPINTSYFEKYSKQRTKLPLYDLHPKGCQNTRILSTAVLCGDVDTQDGSTLNYNAVVKGDENQVTIGTYSSIGEGTVIETCKSLPTGIKASVEIKENVNIGPNCVIRSCIIEDDVKICANSVVMEGCRLGKGCIIGAGSVVPPGRLVPDYQLWSGNPVEYVRDIKGREQDTNLNEANIIAEVSNGIVNNYTVNTNAYLLRESTKDEVDPEDYLVRKNYEA